MKSLLLNKKVILYLIIINAIVIFIQEFDSSPPFFFYIDNIFTIIFALEIIVKIQRYGYRRFIRSNWNKLDVIVVSLALISMIFSIVSSYTTFSLEFLTSLRIFRLFKSFRLLKFVPKINTIIDDVNRAIKTSSIIILSFIILLFIISVFTCSVYKNIAPEYFDNPLNSLYSIFRIFSVEGWYEIPDLIASRTSGFVAFISKLYFVLILFFCGILGMSLINSIFVDTMISDNNDELKMEVKELNRKIDELNNEIRELIKTKNETDE